MAVERVTIELRSSPHPAKVEMHSLGGNWTERGIEKLQQTLLDMIDHDEVVNEQCLGEKQSQNAFCPAHTLMCWQRGSASARLTGGP